MYIRVFQVWTSNSQHEAREESFHCSIRESADRTSNPQFAGAEPFVQTKIKLTAKGKEINAPLLRLRTPYKPPNSLQNPLSSTSTPTFPCMNFHKHTARALQYLASSVPRTQTLPSSSIVKSLIVREYCGSSGS